MPSCRHVIRARDLSPADLHRIYDRATHFKNTSGTHVVPERPLAGHRIILCFYEASTRTRLSFAAAAQNLGADIIGTENAAEFSSAIKGETPGDTARVLSGYGSLIVMRHPDITAVQQAAAVSQVPVINAGNGTDEHPTQAMLDLCTMWECFGNTGKERTITFVGDLARGRTVHSLLQLPALYGGEFVRVRRVNLVAPKAYELPPQLFWGASRTFPDVQVHAALTPEALAETDVLYMTRPQRERNTSDVPLVDYGPFTLTPELARALPEEAIIMHPLPRNSELPTELDTDPRARYFEQSDNGLFVRMALLEFLLAPRSLE